MRGRIRQEITDLLFRVVTRDRKFSVTTIALGDVQYKNKLCPAYCEISKSLSDNRIFMLLIVSLTTHRLIRKLYLYPDGSFKSCERVLSEQLNIHIAQSLLTRLVQLLSHSSVLDKKKEQSESRPKNTSQVAPATSQTTNVLHGGDGASGEVENSESQGGNDESNSNSSSSSSSASSNGGGGCAADSTLQRELSSVDKSDYAAGATAQPGQPDGQESQALCPQQSVRTACSSDISSSAEHISECNAAHAGDANASVAAADVTEEGTGSPARESQPSTEWAVQSAGCADADGAQERHDGEIPSAFDVLKSMKNSACSNSTRARRMFGGQFSSLCDIKPSPRLISKARSIFSKLVSDVSEGEPGPRWDAHSISLKAAGYLRTWTMHDRKHERGRPAILVLADVSGSMSKFANEVLALAAALHRIGVPGAEVVAVAQSNGRPLEALYPNKNKIEEVNLDDDQDEISYYTDIVKKYNVKVCVLAADWDGAYTYRDLLKQNDKLRLYWLDVWSCSKLKPRHVPFPPHWNEDYARQLFDKSMYQRIKYAFACSSAEDMLQVMQKMINKKEEL